MVEYEATEKTRREEGKKKKLLTSHKDLKNSLAKLGTHEAGNCQSMESRVSVSGLGTTDDYFFIFFNFPSLSLNTFFLHVLLWYFFSPHLRSFMIRWDALKRMLADGDLLFINSNVFLYLNYYFSFLLRWSCKVLIKRDEQLARRNVSIKLLLFFSSTLFFFHYDYRRYLNCEWEMNMWGKMMCTFPISAATNVVCTSIIFHSVLLSL